MIRVRTRSKRVTMAMAVILHRTTTAVASVDDDFVCSSKQWLLGSVLINDGSVVLVCAKKHDLNGFGRRHSLKRFVKVVVGVRRS